MQPESFTDETLQPDESKPEDTIQPELQVANEESRPTTILSWMKNFPISYYAIGSLILLLLLAVICLGELGYWAYTLNNNLTATQQQLESLQEKHTALQANHDALKAENEKLSIDLAQANADLEKNKEGFALSKLELNKKSKSMRDAADRIALLKKMILPLINNDVGVSSEDEATAIFLDWIQSMEDINDPILDAKFKNLITSISNGNPNDAEFFTYLLESIEADLK